MNRDEIYTLGIDIGSTTVKIAILDSANEVLFSSYERHFANIQETLSDLLGRAAEKLGSIHVSPVITGSGGLTLAKHLEVPFVQEVVAVSTALQDYAPQTDVAIELGGEDAKIIYFELVHSVCGILIRIFFVVFMIPRIGLRGYFYGIFLGELLLTLLHVKALKFPYRQSGKNRL